MASEDRFSSDGERGGLAALNDLFDDTPRLEARRQGLISSTSIGLANRGRVLQVLFDLGPTSRAELARHVGVNRATITGIIQPLIDQGILVEGEPLPSKEGGGKPARPIWFSEDAAPICAVLLMHDGVHCCLVSLDGTITAEVRAPFPEDAATVEPLIDILFDCVGQVLDLAHRPPLGIGVAAGGMIDTDTGTIVAVNLAPLLDGFPLGATLARRFGLPVRVDHHPRALLVGDRWFGVGRGKRNFAVIYTGDVLGGAIFLDGHLYRGPAGAGGELGHTFVQVDGATCRCGRRGCWETIATVGWLRGQAGQLDLPSPDILDSRKLAALAAENGGPAAGLLDLYARNIAIGIANLQQTMAPNFFVLHGDVAGAGAALLAAITAHVRDLVPWRPGGDIELVMGDLEDRAALKGAAGLILSELLHFAL
ncbi:ROK family protein [Labrys sp. KNU-23]|uniref:ROK family transcriptional regulator n=1 Tax=Labrys sp. KNU-23 TaxID=2789216 RepID=UPI0011EF363D|nr:ROK family transcriptional regulator [Labrys sp. KNU-23]QEN89202.1 ROK family protein [Labrys sp. KNU-23]